MILFVSGIKSKLIKEFDFEISLIRKQIDCFLPIYIDVFFGFASVWDILLIFHSYMTLNV